MESHENPGRAGAAMARAEAAGSLSAIDGSRSWLADRVIAPGWYHLAFGLLAGVPLTVAGGRRADRLLRARLQAAL